MIAPVRCFSCGKPLGHLWEEYKEKTKSKDRGEILDQLRVKRYCCRALFLGHVDLIDTAAQFKKF